MLRAALALALTLATAANAAQSLGAPRELARDVELVVVPLDTQLQLAALCAELEAAAKNSRHGVSAKTDGGTGGRVPSTAEGVCEIFVVEGELVVVGGKAQFLSHDPIGYSDSYSLYAFAGFDPINKRDPFGLAGEQSNYTPGSAGAWTPGPKYVPPPPAPRPGLPLTGYSPTPMPGAGAGAAAEGAAAAERGAFGRVFGPASIMMSARDNRDPRILDPPDPYIGAPVPEGTSGSEGGPGSGGAPDVPVGDPAGPAIVVGDPQGPATVVQVGGKQGEAIQDIEDLIPHVEEHIEKLRENPESRDVSHWQDEINTALDKMESKLKHLGKKSHEKWRGRIDAYREDPVMSLSGTGKAPMPMKPGTGRVPGLLTGGSPGAPGGIGGGPIPPGDCRKSLAGCR